MDLILKRATSKRYFQLSFEGFRPFGKNRLQQVISIWLGFVKSLLGYAYKKINSVLYLLYLVVVFVFKFPTNLKNYLIRKLIWSRGRLGRPIASFIVLCVALGIFMFGEVFSSSRLVVNTPVNADYLATTSDIIPKKEIAVTTIPEARQRTEALDYAVQSGDTLYSIGTKFKVSSDALKYVNNLSDSSILSVGQKLTIPPVAGLIHTVVSGDSLASIAAEYDVPSQSIADFNYLLDNNLTVGTDLVIPGAKIPQAPVIQQPNDTYIPSSIGSGSNVKADPNFCAWPSTVTDISQGFWWGHTAIDIDTNPNGPMPPLFACNDGVVTRAGWDVWGLGLRVTIDHGNGITTTYGHMSRIDVSVGQRVKRGQIIGLMGSTFAPPYGHSTGPHVHFIVDYNGVPQNPLNFTHR